MRSILRPLLPLALTAAASGQLKESPLTTKAKPTIYDSVVKIECATQVPDYRTPWNSGRFSGGRGTGFLIGPNQFLTNAHVVSDARRLLITRRGSAQKHVARIKHIAHDCDLALLELEYFAPFEDLKPIEIGGMPQLESEVSTIGYPVGGDRLSVTRGVVSRIPTSSFKSMLQSTPETPAARSFRMANSPGLPSRGAPTPTTWATLFPPLW
jgi:S1-C subfamily serine protease